MRFRKKLEKFFVYFFTGISMTVVILGIQRSKTTNAFEATPSPDATTTSGASGSNDQQASVIGALPPATGTEVLGTSEIISAVGKLYTTPWGDVGTSIQVKDGKIVSVDVPTLPDSPPSIAAKTILIQEALKAGSANVQSVSGATITSKAFKASLENALAVAKSKKGLVVATYSSTTNSATTPLGATTPKSIIKKVVTAILPTPAKKAPTSPVADPTPVDTGVSGTFTGNAYSTPWGNTVASITLVNGVITDVTMPQVPDSPPSQYAKSYLIEQALASGSANIQGVSGATIVSDAFKSSLESALAKARAQGVVPVVTKTTITQTPPPVAPAPVTPPIVPPPTPVQTNTTAAPTSVNGYFTGDPYSTPWGNTVAAVTITNGKITGVTMPSVPNSSPSLYAQPYLIAQAIAAGSSSIQGVSGATIVSDAFKSSLESALTKARSTGVVQTPAPTTPPPPAPAVPPPTITPQPVTQPTTPPPAAAPATVSGTFIGTPYSTKWGNAEVSVTFTKGVLTGVTMPQIPNSPPSQQAAPYLIQQALAAGGANIQGVSGATIVSNAFKLSLESAIVMASNSGTIAPTPTTPSPVVTPAPTTTTTRRHHDDD